jgi:hypothetical protein
VRILALSESDTGAAITLPSPKQINRAIFTFHFSFLFGFISPVREIVKSLNGACGHLILADLKIKKPAKNQPEVRRPYQGDFNSPPVIRFRSCQPGPHPSLARIPLV